MTAEHELPDPDEPATAHPTDPLAPVDSDDALLDRWRLLLGSEPFDARALWVTWYDDRNVQLPVVVPVDDLPLSPDGTFLDNLGYIVSDVLRAAGGAWVSCALVRPGSATITRADRSWADALCVALRDNAVPAPPLFLATSTRLRQLVLDDL